MSLPLHFQSAHAQLETLARGDCTSLELVEQYAARIARHNPQLNAVVVLELERARAQAQAADDARQRGSALGALHGIPMTIKEAFDWQGTPSTWGYEALRGNIAARDAVAVERLQAAGAIILGKTNVPTGLADWQTFNPVYGTTNNPWDLDRTPGGSSGGSAAALAAGLSTLELGSDIGASIRNPAHYCGVYGHKPTWGVVPMAGHAPPGIANIDSLDIGVAGPMARNARDLQTLMDVLCTPLQQFGPSGWQAAQWRPIERAPHTCRVAIIDDDPIAPVADGLRARLHDLADFLRREGVTVIECRRPVDSAHSHRVYLHLLRAATGALLDDTAYARMQALAQASDPARDGIAERTWRGSTLSHRDWFAFDQQRTVLRAQWQAFFQDVDLVIAPTATTPAFAHNHVGERWERLLEVNGQLRPSTDGLFWAGYSGLIGLPATAIPLGFCPSTPPEADNRNSRQLPVGAQIIGPHFGDPMCLAMARWLEEAWHGFVPPPGY